MKVSAGQARAEQEQLFEGAAPRLAGQVRLGLFGLSPGFMLQHQGSMRWLISARGLTYALHTAG